MLEVSPSIGTIEKPKLAIYPLGIGGKSDPVRLVFSGKPADAVVVSMADERERFRLLMDEVTIVEPQGSLKNLPCARAVWKPKPDLKTAVQCWITAGGSHHTCMTTSVGREAWEDFARIAGVELRRHRREHQRPPVREGAGAERNVPPPQQPSLK